MQKYDNLYKAINNLLSHLRSCHVREKIDTYYLDGYGNSAPGELFESYLNKLQAELDKVEDEI